SFSMSPGVSVLGSYKDTGVAAWPRTISCSPTPSGSPACYTRIVAQDDLGVVFPANSTAPTTLDGVFVSARSGGVVNAVTVPGAGTISNSCINTLAGSGAGVPPSGAEVYGIDIQGSSVSAPAPLITGNFINGFGVGGGGG